MRLAFGYIRRSSYKQQDNNSVEIQKQHIQEFAARNKLNIPDEFILIEDVTSAYSKKATQRKALMRLKEQMIEMKIPILIFHDVSRMDRTGYSFTLDFYRPLLKLLPNLEVYTTKSSDPIDPDSMDMKMNFLLSQHESEVKSERAIGSLVNDLNQVTPIRPGSRTPFGYTQINKKLLQNESAEIVSFIFYLYCWGHSLKKIAFLLNEVNIPSPRGKIWRPSTIDNIIKNPVYTGDLNWNIPKLKDGQKKYTFENTHEPIIDNFHLQLQQKNKMLQDNYGRIDTPFLLLNKIKCQHCYCILVTQNGSTTRNGKSYLYQYYVCKNCNYKLSIDEAHEKIVPMIMKRVHQLISKQQMKEHTLEFLNQTNNIVDQLIPKTERSIVNLVAKLKLARDIDDRELELSVSTILESHKKLLSDYNHCKGKISTSVQAVESDIYITRFRDILKFQLGTNEKRLIILYFIDYILISPRQQTDIRYKTNIFDDLIPTK
ncbi:recombinase family protein [Sporosarcina sp. CAU 1771]